MLSAAFVVSGLRRSQSRCVTPHPAVKVSICTSTPEVLIQFCAMFVFSNNQCTNSQNECTNKGC